MQNAVLTRAKCSANSC